MKFLASSLVIDRFMVQFQWINEPKVLGLDCGDEEKGGICWVGEVKKKQYVGSW